MINPNGANRNLQNNQFKIQPYQLRAKEPTKFIKYYSWENADRRLEVIPSDRDSFDVLSFIDFTEHLEPFFFCEAVKGVKIHKLNVFRNKDQNVMNKLYVFQIEFGTNLQSIKVFMRYHLLDFAKLSTFTDLFIYVGGKVPIMQSLQINNMSVKQKFLSYFTNMRHECPQYIKSILQQIRGQTVRIRKPKLQIIDVMEKFSGYIHIDFPHSSNDQNLKDNSFSYITIIFPWTLQILPNMQYIELDASFKAMDPKVFSIVHGIKNNESYPLGITIASSETSKLYQVFWDKLSLYMDFNLENMVVLSDMGRGLKSFCENNQIKQFYCHRHIIERFGSSSVLALFAARLLRSFSEKEYREQVILVRADLNHYIFLRFGTSRLPPEFKKKKEILEIMLTYEDIYI